MDRILSRVKGHQTQIQRMLQYFASNLAESRLSGQAWLFAGPSGVGKKLVARGLAQAILCESKPAPCGICGSCLRVSSGHHESLLEIAPDGATIKMEQAHQILEFLNLQSVRKSRVIIIDEVNKLNPQSGNSLLKSLEEPPEGTIFFLVSSALSAVLPTIRSRCKKVLFQPLSHADLKFLRSSPDWAIKASRGRLDRLNMLSDQDELESRNQAVACLQDFFQNPDFLTESNWRQCFSDRQTSLRILQYWLSLIRDSMVITSSATDSRFADLLMNPDQMPLLNLLASKKSQSLMLMSKKLIQLEAEWSLNFDPTLAIEDLWVQNKEVLF